MREYSIAVDRGSFDLQQWRLGIESPFEGGFSLRAEASQFSVRGFRLHSEAERSFGNVRLGWEGEGADHILSCSTA